MPSARWFVSVLVHMGFLELALDFSSLTLLLFLYGCINFDTLRVDQHQIFSGLAQSVFISRPHPSQYTGAAGERAALHTACQGSRSLVPEAPLLPALTVLSAEKWEKTEWRRIAWEAWKVRLVVVRITSTQIPSHRTQVM